VMTKCMGEEVYWDWMGDVKKAYKACYAEPMKKPFGLHADKTSSDDVASDLMNLLKGDRPVLLPLIISQQENGKERSQFDILKLLSQSRQKRGVFYDAPVLKHLMTKALAKVSNYTCVMEKLQIVDENLNLQIDTMKEGIKTAVSDPSLRDDLVEIVDYCSKFSMCLPDDSKSPMPIELKRLMAFMKCDKKLRMSMCMKRDILEHLEFFDVSALPFNSQDEEEMAEKLLHVLWGSEAKDAFAVY